MIQFSLIHNNLSLQNKCIRYTAELIHVIYTKYSNRRPKLRLPQPLAPPTTGDITWAAYSEYTWVFLLDLFIFLLMMFNKDHSHLITHLPVLQTSAHLRRYDSDYTHTRNQQNSQQVSDHNTPNHRPPFLTDAHWTMKFKYFQIKVGMFRE